MLDLVGAQAERAEATGGVQRVVQAAERGQRVRRPVTVTGGRKGVGDTGGGVGGSRGVQPEHVREQDGVHGGVLEVIGATEHVADLVAHPRAGRANAVAAR